MSSVIYALPFCVQRAPMPVKPISRPFDPFVWLWSDPFSKQVGLKFVPLRHAKGVASRPHSMVVLLFSSICLICFRLLQSFLRFLVRHKFFPVVSYLLIPVIEIRSLIFQDKVGVQSFLPVLELLGHLLKSPRLDFFLYGIFFFFVSSSFGSSSSGSTSGRVKLTMSLFQRFSLPLGPT